MGTFRLVDSRCLLVGSQYIVAFLLLLLPSVVLAAESGKTKLSTPQITTSIRPLGLIARAVAGEYGQVTIVMDNGASAHHYSLTVSDRLALQSADVVLWVGESLETMLVKPLKQRGQMTVEAMDLPHIQWPSIKDEADEHKAHAGSEDSRDEGHGHENHDHNDSHHTEPGHDEHAGHYAASDNHEKHGHEEPDHEKQGHDKQNHEEHDHGDRDPHIWLNPYNSIEIAEALAISLSRAFPHHRPQYEANLARLKQSLESLDVKLTTQLKPLQSKAFIVAHPAYGHFVDRYQLNQQDYIALTPERKAGAKHLYKLTQHDEVRCVIADYGSLASATKKLSTSLNVPVVTLNPLGVDSDSIVELIEQIALGFQVCLEG